MPRMHQCLTHTCGQLVPAGAQRCARCTRRRRADGGGRDSSAWQTLRAQVRERDGSCIACGGDQALQVHHVIPRDDGGPDHPGNLVTLCATCHAQVENDTRRGLRTPIRERVEAYAERLTRGPQP